MQSESMSGDVESIRSQPSNSEILEILPIKDSPFSAVRVDTKFFLALGRYRLTQLLESFEDCEAEASNASWHRLLQVIEIVLEERLDQENKKRIRENNNTTEG